MYSDEKIVQSALYILHKLGETDRHKLFKILYFAEMKHLSRYGRPINGNDHYVKMDFGPVPSRLFDFIKTTDTNKLASESFIVSGKMVSPKKSPDVDYLSQSDIDCLEESMTENKDLSFAALTRKSHGPAWTHAKRYIPFVGMAQEAGVNEEMVKYILTSQENLNCI